MIIYALVLGSAVCLGCAVFIDWDFLSYAALGFAVIGLALFVWQAVRARMAAHRPDAGAGPGEPEEPADHDESGDSEESEKDSPGTTDGAEVSEAETPDSTLVHVISGRKRFHSGECRTLKGVSSQQLTPAEAEEEGFTPCTLCKPAQRTEGVLS